MSTRVMQPRQILQDITKKTNNLVSRPPTKMRNPNDMLEDEDCLVNIMDYEETNIEVQPTLMHSRQHLATENLFKDI